MNKEGFLNKQTENTAPAEKEVEVKETKKAEKEFIVSHVNKHSSNIMVDGEMKFVPELFRTSDAKLLKAIEGNGFYKVEPVK